MARITPNEIKCDNFLNRNLSIIKKISTYSPKATHMRLFHRARKELIYVNRETTNNNQWNIIIEQLQNEIITNTDVFFRRNIRVKIDEFTKVFDEVSIKFDDEKKSELNSNFLHILNFIKWFNDISLTTPNNQHQQDSKKDEDKQGGKKYEHQNIFISNGFDVWQEMYNKFQITESSRTDVKFMFEIMKRDKMIHKSVSQKAYLEWIYDVFFIDVQKTSNIDLKNTKNLGIYDTAKSMFIK